MYTLTELVQPNTLEEAYRALMAKGNNTLLGGCAFLRLTSKKVGTGIDLSTLALDDIKEQDGYIEIGAMASFRAVETSPVLQQYFTAVLSQAVGGVIGVQFRQVVTVGATVFGRYGFSDLITPLLVLDTEVELYKQGRMTLAAFLDSPRKKDILTKVWIKQDQSRAVYRSLRNSAGDFPILNVAVARLAERWRIAVGARPLRAKLATKAAALLSQGALNTAAIAQAATLAAEELSFGTNARGSAEYRQALCRTLVKRAVTEVLECK
ncbi:MAG: FAD binding domain-containing protein [Negativicutes bacterium]|nr:FAD binding domain-containing protein [Negativicutes bacterium]